MKRVLYIALFTTILFQGCTSKKEVQPPSDVHDIKENKMDKRLRSVRIIDQYHDSKAFKVFLNQDNRIQYICSANSKCDYYDKTKHDYTVNSDLTEDIVWVYKNSFSPDFSKHISGIQCGRGSMAGMFVLIDTDKLKNHNKDNLKYCYNRFTKLDSMQIGTKITTGILTLGTSLFTSGNMHTVKFDEEEFREAIVNSNLDKYQDKLYGIKELFGMKYGYDVIYIDSNNVKKSLEKAYERFNLSKHKRDGILFIDEERLKPLSLITFKEYKRSNIISNISLQINDLLSAIVFKANENLITYEDVLKYIPAKIEKPLLPSYPVLEKDEFETKKEFNQRVLNAVKQREQAIATLQKAYNLKILKRNEYINGLESSYKNYLENIANQTNQLQSDLKENVGLLAQILFLLNTQGFDAKEFKYNAEVQRLYFKVFSKDKKFINKAMAIIPAKYAKRIKREETFRVEPVLLFQNRLVHLRGFNIYETQSNNKYKVIYTNTNFTPLSQTVTITTNKEEIKKLIDTKNFTRYKQNQSSIVSKNDSEIWYIDVVNRMNSKVPKWFSNPDLNNSSIAYAYADTLEEAKAKALHDLALIKNVKVSATIESSNEFGNSIEQYQGLKKTVQTKTNVEFKENDYKVLKQERIDGIWYVALEFIH